MYQIFYYPESVTISKSPVLEVRKIKKIGTLGIWVSRMQLEKALCEVMNSIYDLQSTSLLSI